MDFNGNNVYLLLGSNISPRKHYIQTAAKLLNNELGICIRESMLYETAAWGNQNQKAFINQAMCFNTLLNPQNVLNSCLNIEKKLGRTRTKKWASRTIDIDILLFGNQHIKTNYLQIPHPLLTQRRFALAPLAEIAPNLIHPLTNQTIHTLLQICPDTLAVNPLININLK